MREDHVRRDCREYYYRSNGVNRHICHYLGRIKDKRFYTMEEYRRTFDRFGNRRTPESRTAGIKFRMP